MKGGQDQALTFYLIFDISLLPGAGLELKVKLRDGHIMLHCEKKEAIWKV